MILCVALNPSVDRTLFIDKLIPNDTNRVLRAETDAGGKGINVARMLTALGVPCMGLTFLGGPEGEVVRHVLERESVPFKWVSTELPTRVNLVVEESNGKPPTALNEAGPKISESERVEMNALLERLGSQASLVVVGGSLPAGYASSTYAALVRKFPRVVVDADGEAMRLAVAERPYMIKPNGFEASRLLSTPVNSANDALSASGRLFEMGVSVSLVSMGSQGCALTCDEGTYWAKAPEIESRSTIGAGDSLVAGFLSGLEQNLSMGECLRLGAAAGAATAESDGASMGAAERVKELSTRVKIEKIR